MEEPGKKHLSLVKFVNNNNFLIVIGMTMFKALYRRRCRTPLCQDEVGERKLVGLELVQITTYKIQMIRARMKEAKINRKVMLKIKDDLGV